MRNKKARKIGASLFMDRVMGQVISQIGLFLKGR